MNGISVSATALCYYQRLSARIQKDNNQGTLPLWVIVALANYARQLAERYTRLFGEGR